MRRMYSAHARHEPIRVTSHPNHDIVIVPTSLRHKSTIIDPIQGAIDDIESREDGAAFSYREVAKQNSKLT